LGSGQKPKPIEPLFGQYREFFFNDVFSSKLFDNIIAYVDDLPVILP